MRVGRSGIGKRDGFFEMSLERSFGRKTEGTRSSDRLQEYQV